MPAAIGGYETLHVGEEEQEGNNTFREMRRIGYKLEDVSLHYRGNHGLDLVFSKGNSYAIAEAKHGKSMSALKMDSLGLRQGSNLYNRSRLERYILHGDGKYNNLANRLLSDTYLGTLESFVGFYRGKRLVELPSGWTKGRGINR